jgi:ketosteroid isomerase-like protein
MSQQNVEIVRRVYDAVARRERESVLAYYDPEIRVEWLPGSIADVLGTRVIRGYDGLRLFDREWREAFEGIETLCEEIIDAGDAVVTASKYRARGRGSGVEVEGPLQFGVWTFREGKIVKVVWFPTREEALEAAGHEE